MHFKKLQDILSKQNSEIEFLIMFCLKKKVSFELFDEIKMSQISLIFTIRMSNHMLSKARKSAPKLAQLFAT